METLYMTFYLDSLDIQRKQNMEEPENEALDFFDEEEYISDINEEESYLMDEEQPEEVLYFDPDEKKYKNYVEVEETEDNEDILYNIAVLLKK